MGSILAVTSEFNKDLVKALYQSAQTEFENQIQRFMLKEAWKIKFGQSSPKLKQVWIPGAGEIPQAVKWCLDEQAELKRRILRHLIRLESQALKRLKSGENIDLAEELRLYGVYKSLKKHTDQLKLRGQERYCNSLLQKLKDSAAGFKSLKEEERLLCLQHLIDYAGGKDPCLAAQKFKELTGSKLFLEEQKLKGRTGYKDYERQYQDLPQKRLKELTGYKDYKSLEAEQVLAVLALAVVIRGQTEHFDFLKNFLRTALWDLQKTYSCPIVFSVLFLEGRKQFKDRIIRGNEGMSALLKMLDFQSCSFKRF